MTKITSRNVITNMLWRFFERTGAQFVTLLVTVLIARVLEPELYGKVALISVLIVILQVFVDAGLGTALIQKKDPDDLDYSSVFYFNIVFCVVAYAMFYAIVPFITNYYQMPDLIPAMRVSGLTIVISGIKNVQQAYVSKNLLFKKFFFSTLSGTIIAGIVGITLAYSGFGTWALVIQDLTNKAIDTIVLWGTVKWRPKKLFSFVRLKSLLSYGWKMFASGILDTTYNGIRQLIIGKKYSTEDLAFYNQGVKYPRFVVLNLNTAIDSVLLPSMSEYQNDMAIVKEMTRKAIKISTFVTMPLMCGLAVCSDFLVKHILTDKWLPAVPYIRIFCITYAFYVIHTANLNAIKAVGRSDIHLKLEFTKIFVGLAILLSTMWHGVMGIALGGIVSSFASQIINAWPNKKLLNYGYVEQIIDIVPNLIVSLIMGGTIYIMSYLPLGGWLLFALQVIIGVIVYLLFSYLFRIDSLSICYNILVSFTKKKQVKCNEQQ